MKEKGTLDDRNASPFSIRNVVEPVIVIFLVLGGFAFILHMTSPSFVHSHLTSATWLKNHDFSWAKVHGAVFDQFAQDEFVSEDLSRETPLIDDKHLYKVESLLSKFKNGKYEKIVRYTNIEKDVLINKQTFSSEYVNVMEYEKDEILKSDKRHSIENNPDIDSNLENVFLRKCREILKNERFDCHPEENANEVKCLERGCCWHKILPQNSSDSSSFGVPYCFYPENYQGYSVLGLTQPSDIEFMVDMQRTKKSYYPDEVKQVMMNVMFETDYRMRVKFYDINKPRWEVPTSQPKSDEKVKYDDYMYTFNCPAPNNSFFLTVTRTSTNTTILNTTGAFMFNDQFLQLSYFLPSSNIYGLGEHRDTLMHSVNWTKFVMWNKDQPPEENMNLYGSHPFYLVMEEDGNSHGVLLLNSNAMEAILQPAPAITWRTIGGVLDFYIFFGPTPSDVISQYTEIIGLPFMPPYWSLGYHQCRWGYKTANQTQAMADKLTKAGMPQDVQWNDIDYMDKMRDFTTSPDYGDQKGLVDNLHSQGKHYMMIVDPGISTTLIGKYPPYDVGVSMGIFINDSDGNLLVGEVWPGTTVFPDFTNDLTTKYWTQMVKDFHDQVAFDGMWIDMNEISNFVAGSVSGCPKTDRYENPPYLPGVQGGSLRFNTICASGRQHLSRTYDVHNLYGLGETNASYSALLAARPGKRPFIISRSTFPGQGQFGGHWTGDNAATYYDMYKSISDILSMNMFGIPMVGADICGFRNKTTEALCQRWFQLGAFYPFSRSHNANDLPDQDPTAFSPALLASTREVYLIRYSFLPYLYTLFFRSHLNGTTVARPLFIEFPEDKTTYNVDKQFLWGPAFMICPVLEENVTQVTAYFPRTTWFLFSTGSRVTDVGGTHTLPAPMNHINLNIRGGFIIPMQKPALTSTDSRKNPFWLLVALLPSLEAKGELYWDDGDSVDSFSTGTYNLFEFTAINNTLTSDLKHVGYTAEPMTLGNVTVLGVKSTPKSVTVNGETTPFNYSSNHQVLYITELKVDLTKTFSLIWR